MRIKLQHRWLENLLMFLFLGGGVCVVHDAQKADNAIQWIVLSKPIA